MNSRHLRTTKFDTLKFSKTLFGGSLSAVLGTKAFVIALVFIGLSGCMPNVPSTFPDIQLPSPQSPVAIPSPSSSTSQPSSSGLPQPSSGSQSSPTPTPSLPSPTSPSSGSPSIPQPPTPLPSPESSNGNPSLPTIPAPPGSENNSESGDVSGGTPMPENGTTNDGQQDDTGGGGTEGSPTELPPGDMTIPEGDSNGQPEGEQTGAAGGNEMLPEDEGGSGGGWETSNQLPDPSAGDSEEGGNSDEDADESDGAGVAGDEELQEVLGELDGEILNERNAENARAGDDIANSGLLDVDDDDVGTGDEYEDLEGSDNTSETEQESTGVGEVDEPVLPGTRASATDTPDATDKDVIVRQLEEAVAAEEDPDLKEKLQKELDTYRDGLK